MKLENLTVPRKPHTPFSLIALLVATVLCLGLFSRLVYFGLSGEEFTAATITQALFYGPIFDFAVAMYLFLPFAAFGLLPRTWWERSWLQSLIYTVYFVEVLVVAYGSLAEVFFVKEFKSRFNFIAVDYLVYTNEVLKNLWESFPMWWILTGHVLLVFAITFFVFPKSAFNPGLRFRPVAFVGAALAGMCFWFVSEASILQNMPAAAAEAAKNPVHAIFAAYRNNEINFKRFYTVMNDVKAAHIVHEAFEQDIAGLQGNEDENEDETSIVRNIVKKGPEKHLNVVIVLMESMSARFMHSLGSDNTITPTLDELAATGLFFDHIYATGTRTVRGIEAVMLSIPPTPGQSIVRRPDSGEIFNIGSVFRDRGYVTQFLYGGKSFFDNMGGFFSSNGFSVIDQSSMTKAETTFSNAWGVCDEDLFNLAVKSADQAGSKPFLQFILTTSNHRPYTYPSGKTKIPSGTGRDGAVEYSDFAIRKFLETARGKPWFKDTVFVFVADHDAAVSGGTKVLPSDYHIPLIFYSPAHIPARRVSILGSQIDVAPTLMALLNFSYQSRFFGHDLIEAKTERAFLATYQKVGLWQNGKLILLSPNRQIETFTVVGESVSPLSTHNVDGNQNDLDPDIETAIAYYETASNWFTEKLLKESTPASKKINLRTN